MVLLAIQAWFVALSVRTVGEYFAFQPVLFRNIIKSTLALGQGFEL